MSAWYEVYDNVDVQLLTRKRAAAMTGAVALAIMLSAALLALGLSGFFPLQAALGTVAIGWTGFVWWCVHRRRRLRSLAWCVKISDVDIVGYDYARRKSSLSWNDVERIDVRSTGLVVYGRSDVQLEIAHLFPQFPELSHRIIAYGEQHRIPVFVDGVPWQQLDVYDVYPFLSSVAAGAGSVTRSSR